MAVYWGERDIILWTIISKTPMAANYINYH